jgi:DNA polymerase-3 subunit epsilon
MTTTGRADTVVVLDFETSGLSPARGDRAIEIGAVRIEGGRIRDRFQQLINPGFRISGFIESYTGISNAMLRAAPPADEVMAAFADFIAGHPLVAHNAAFDRRFLDAELAPLGRRDHGEFACSMLVARRLFPAAPNHRLGSLVAYRGLDHDGVFHRALADAEMTARLWLDLLAEIERRHGLAPVPFRLMQQLGRTPRHAVDRLFGGCARPA